MNPNVYTRPNKPAYTPVKRRRDAPAQPVEIEVPQVVAVHASSECHVTPGEIAARMVDYLGAAKYGHTLEPSAGTGSIVKALNAAGHLVQAVEVNYSLCEVLRGMLPAHRVHHGDFIEWAENIFSERDKMHAQYDRVVMNPPFSKIASHMKAAEKLLAPGGVLVALVPVTFKHANAETLEQLGPDTFASCKVNTKIILIEG